MTRTPIKNLLLTALHLLICCAVSAAAICIQYLFMKPTGETVSSFLFSSEIGGMIFFLMTSSLSRNWSSAVNGAFHSSPSTPHL